MDYRIKNKYSRSKRAAKKRNLLLAGILTVVAGFSFFGYQSGLFTSNGGMPDTIMAIENQFYKDSVLATRSKREFNESALDSFEVKVDTVQLTMETPVHAEATNEPASTPPPIAKAPTVEEPQNFSTENFYKVISKAYFYDKPDESTRRSAFINHWNNSYADLKGLDEKNGFIYVVFTNHLNQTSKGWLKKKDLKEIKSIAYNDQK